jgi:hypothetical protein
MRFLQRRVMKSTKPLTVLPASKRRLKCSPTSFWSISAFLERVATKSPSVSDQCPHVSALC